MRLFESFDFVLINKASEPKVMKVGEFELENYYIAPMIIARLLVSVK